MKIVFIHVIRRSKYNNITGTVCNVDSLHVYGQIHRGTSTCMALEVL